MAAVIAHASQSVFNWRQRRVTHDEFVANSDFPFQVGFSAYITSRTEGKSVATAESLAGSLNHFADFLRPLGINSFGDPDIAVRVDFEEFKNYLDSIVSYRTREKLTPEIQQKHYREVLRFCGEFLKIPEAGERLLAEQARARKPVPNKHERSFFDKILPRFDPDQKEAFDRWQKEVAKGGDATLKDFHCSLNHFANFLASKNIDRFDVPNLTAKIKFKELRIYCNSIKNHLTGEELIPLRQRRHYLRILEFCADGLQMRKAKAAWLGERGRRKHKRKKQKQLSAQIQKCKGQLTHHCQAVQPVAADYTKCLAFAADGSPPSEREARLLLGMLELLSHRPTQAEPLTPTIFVSSHADMAKRFRKKFGSEGDVRRSTLVKMDICKSTGDAELNPAFVEQINISERHNELLQLAEKYRHYLADRALNYSQAAAAASIPAPWMLPPRPDSDPRTPVNVPDARQRPRP